MIGAPFDMIGATVPVIQAPMAGSGGVALAVAAIRGGGVGSLPCAMLSPDQIVAEAAAVRAEVTGPINLNFFCHQPPTEADARQAAWRAALQPFYDEERVVDAVPPPERRPFDAAAAAAVAQVRPAIVSFHFGLPHETLIARVRASGALILGNATSVAEAEWLARAGCDAVIAQGFEAGGHAGWFLDAHCPVGTMALVPQVVDAVDVPVIAAGGIADPRGTAAAIALGAAGVQVGTAYLRCTDSLTRPVHRRRLVGAGSGDSVFTNVFSGGIARGLPNRLIETMGAIGDHVPPFPLAAAALAPLRARAEADGRDDYSPLWAGQAAPLATGDDATALTRNLGDAALRQKDLL